MTYYRFKAEFPKIKQVYVFLFLYYIEYGDRVTTHTVTCVLQQKIPHSIPVLMLLTQASVEALKVL